MVTFPNVHGVKKNAYKQTVDGFIPRSVIVPLNQDSDVDCKCLVEEGSPVEEGQLLATYTPNKKNKYPQNVYSPIPGKVEKVLLSATPNGRMVQSVKINLQGSFKYVGKKLKELDYRQISPDSLIRDIAEKGILNTFVTSDAIPLADEMGEVKSHDNRLLIVRLFDDDPSRMVDSILSNLYMEKINQGIKIAAKAIDADGIVIVTDNNIEHADMFNPFDLPCHFLKLKSKEYPSSFKKNICRLIKKQMKQAPFNKINQFDLFTDSSTMYELYHCIKYNVPVISRIVHVTGNCTPASGIIKTPVGTTFADLAEQCGGFVQKPAAIIVNGMITGFSAVNLDTPVTKYVKSVNFITKFQTPDQRQTVCVRCGNCREACPIKLSPDIIYRHITGGLAASSDYIASAQFCSNCGVCNAVCPSRLPISQRIKEFNDIRKAKTEGEDNAY